MENMWQFLKMLNIGLYDPAIPLGGILPKKLKTGTQIDVCTPVHSSIIPNSQKTEAIQVFIYKWMDKQNAENTHIGLFSHKKGRILENIMQRT